MPTAGERLVQATEPTRGPILPWLKAMLGIAPEPQPQQIDPSWHNQMVQQANASFQRPDEQQQQQQPTPMIRRKPLPR